MIKELLGDALTAAKDLLGYKLCFDSPNGLMSGYIVETEAYLEGDPANHASRGRTPRTVPMFGPAGTIYVYFTYGMHYCLNIVTGKEGQGQAVLIRALQPVEGVEIMKLNRQVDNEFNLTNGPAKLTQALGVDKSYNGTNIWNGPIRLESGIVPSDIVQTTRIGINQATDMPWRFYIQNNPYISRL